MSASKGRDRLFLTQLSLCNWPSIGPGRWKCIYPHAGNHERESKTRIWNATKRSAVKTAHHSFSKYLLGLGIVGALRCSYEPDRERLCLSNELSFWTGAIPFLHSACTSATYAAEHISARKYSRSPSYCNALVTINKLKCGRRPVLGQDTTFYWRDLWVMEWGRKTVEDEREQSSEKTVRGHLWISEP